MALAVHSLDKVRTNKSRMRVVSCIYDSGKCLWWSAKTTVLNECSDIKFL